MRKTTTVQKVPFLAPDVVTKIIPAPTDGWDAISPLAEMDPKRAPILNNFVPRPGFVELRGGNVPFAMTMTGTPAETLMVYRSASGEKFFVASGGKIIDITNGGAGTAGVTGLTSNRWQYINFTDSAGNKYIQCVNGVDALRQFNGATWSAPSITGTLPDGSSVSTSKFIQIYAQKQRLWYFPVNTTFAVFMPIGAVSGAIAGAQDFGLLWTKGGHIVAMADWTIDGGSGPQDYAVFLSSRGQITLYAGTDPTNTAAWSLVGTFDISPPISSRCMTRVGSDVAVITQQGVIPISQALPFDPSADRSVAITARIQNVMAKAALNYSTNFGWQFLTYPLQQLGILNIPQTENNTQIQYVMNTLTGAWCQFTGWNANCFEIFNNQLYFADNTGNVNLAYSGSSDQLNSIIADMQCAFNWLDEPGRVKRMTMIQPLLTLGGSINPNLSVDVDFSNVAPAAPTVSSLSGNVLWDVAVWDSSDWPPTTINYNSFLSAEAVGHAMAIRLTFNIGVTGNSFGVFDIGKFDAAQFDEGFSTNIPTLQVNAFNTISEMGAAI